MSVFVLNAIRQDTRLWKSGLMTKCDGNIFYDFHHLLCAPSECVSEGLCEWDCYFKSQLPKDKWNLRRWKNFPSPHTANLRLSSNCCLEHEPSGTTEAKVFSIELWLFLTFLIYGLGIRTYWQILMIYRTVYWQRNAWIMTILFRGVWYWRYYLMKIKFSLFLSYF